MSYSYSYNHLSMDIIYTSYIVKIQCGRVELQHVYTSTYTEFYV